MKILLDTCTFLWLVAGSRELSQASRDLFSDPGNEVFLSAVSIWEIVIKYGLGRLTLSEPPRTFVPRFRQLLGIQALPLDEDSVLNLGRLPSLHKDPFDRMLICQAIAHGLAILTPDPAILKYPVRTLW